MQWAGCTACFNRNPPLERLVSPRLVSFASKMFQTQFSSNFQGETCFVTVTALKFVSGSFQSLV